MTFEGNLLPASATTQIEKNLVSLGFFVPSGKRIKNCTSRTIAFTRFLDGRKIRTKVVIIPSTRHGLPVTSDQDKYLALKKSSPICAGVTAPSKTRSDSGRRTCSAFSEDNHEAGATTGGFASGLT